jgi:hypothetical protein
MPERAGVIKKPALRYLHPRTFHPKGKGCVFKLFFPDFVEEKLRNTLEHSKLNWICCVVFSLP